MEIQADLHAAAHSTESKVMYMYLHFTLRYLVRYFLHSRSSCMPEASVGVFLSALHDSRLQLWIIKVEASRTVLFQCDSKLQKLPKKREGQMDRPVKDPLLCTKQSSSPESGVPSAVQ